MIPLKQNKTKQKNQSRLVKTLDQQRIIIIKDQNLSSHSHRGGDKNSYQGKDSTPGSDTKYLRCSIYKVSIILKIGDSKRANVIAAAIICLRGYICLQMALTSLQLFLELPSEMSFITFYFKFVGPSLIIYQYHRHGTPWLVFISKSHVFLRELKLFLPKHSK